MNLRILLAVSLALQSFGPTAVQAAGNISARMTPVSGAVSASQAAAVRPAVLIGSLRGAMLPSFSVTPNITASVADLTGPAAPLAELGAVPAPSVAGQTAAPSAAAQLGDARSTLEASNLGPGSSAQQDSEVTSSSRWDAFWSRSSPSEPLPTQIDQAGSIGAHTLSSSLSKPSAVNPSVKKHSVPTPLFGLAAGAAFTLPAWGQAAIALIGTIAVNRSLRWVIDRVADKAGWRPNTKVAVRLIAGIVVWTSGIGTGLAIAGVSSAAIMTTFGLGGIAVTMAAKDLIGNFIHGTRVLINRPFLIGEKIKLGDKDYVVKDMDLRYLQLEREPGSTTLMTYTQLADMSITIFREYSVRPKSALKKSSVNFLNFIRLIRPSQPNMKRAALWTALGLAFVLGLPALSAGLALPWLASSLPYLQGCAILWVSGSVSKWASGVVTRLAEKAGWDKQTSTLVKIAVQAAIYVVGGTMALGTFGVNWSALLAGLGASSVAIGWASADTIGNLIQGFQILISQPFKIGDTLEIGAVKGVVADINLQYVVLEHADKSHTLVPYSVIKASAFTIANKEEKK